MKEDSILKKLTIHRVLVILVFIGALIIMRGYEQTFQLYSKGVGILDMRFGYDGSEVYQLFSTLGKAGRYVYIKNLCIDVIFIISFALLQNYFLKWIMGKEMLESRWRLLLSISYLRGSFDIIENILIFVLLINFQSEFLWLATVSGSVTRVKFILLGLWLAVVPIVFIVRKVRGKRSKSI